MSTPVRHHPAVGQEFERWYERSFDPESVALRQLPFAVAYLTSFLLTALVVDPKRPLMWVGLLVVAAVVVAGFTVPWSRLPVPWQSLLPISQMVALVLLEVGSGLVYTYPSALIFLPVVSLALQRGLTGVVVGTVGALVTMQAIAAAGGADSWDAMVTRTVVTPLTALLVGLGVYGVMQRLRARNEAVQALQLQQADTLAEVRASNEALTVMASRLRSTSELVESVINAATQHAIIGVDADGIIRFYSLGAERLLGYAPEAAVGSSIQTFFDEDQLQAAAEDQGLPWSEETRRHLMIGDVATGGTRTSMWNWRRRDGSQVPVQVVTTQRGPLPDGTRAGYLLVATDVTEQQEADRLQDEFIGLVSHELRTPLTGILGYLELLRMSPDPLTEEQRDDLDVIQRNAERLLRLVTDLLLSVQLSAGTFSVDAEPIDLAEVVRQSAHNIDPIADAAGVTMVVDADHPIRLQADPLRLAQAVENVLSNAVKFTPKDGSVTVRAFERPGDPPTAVIEVTDTGIGIAPAELSRLTERFFRSRTARDRRGRGIGLGLPITQAIIEAHRGRMDVASEPGSGTTFTLSLPIDRGAPIDRSAPTGRSAPTAS